ncbi:MAG: xanthine dehydrogenase accessory protein XdhC [Kordiimonadales bacterium]|nr:MAG: xanthine dehydrogenase accessory protein XdhC [Kordiimonadales bacterium]
MLNEQARNTVWDWVESARKFSEEAAFILVTIVGAKGSVPRETGTKMLVSDCSLEGTIGGGNFEFKIIEQARKFLKQTDTEYVFQSYALGPLLEQCCGGNVTILLERIEAGAAFLTEPRKAFLKTTFTSRGLHKEWHDHYAQRTLFFVDGQEDRFEGEPKNAAAMLEQVSRRPQQLYMFGAGHVGRAVAAALRDLPFRVTWADSRESEFPERIAANIEKRCTEDYLAVAEEAEPDALYLIFTHSHLLDLELVGKILGRDDALYCGLIGSKTKRARFEKKLADNADTATLDTRKLTCPMGVAGITGKEPSVIAVAVVAELMQQIDGL